MVIVTGMIGAGKSALSGELARLGALVLSADEVVHSLYAEDADLVAELEGLVGRSLRDSEGSFQRSVLADAIFADQGLRRKVEGAVHPRVAERVARFVAEHSGELVVYDVPLWPEGADRRGAELVVEVVAPAALRLSRLVERGMDPLDAERRIAVQADGPRGEVDLEIVNDGGTERLTAEALRIVAKLQGVTQ